MRNFSIVLIIAAVASCFLSFVPSASHVPDNVIGLWEGSKANDEPLRDLTFEFSESGFQVLTSNGEAVGRGQLFVVEEEVAIAVDPFVYATREVMYLTLESTASTMILPEKIQIRSVSKSHMQIYYKRGKTNCFVTLRKIKR